MASKRMFTQEILNDRFFSLSHSAMAFYFTLCLLADDDGFYANPKDLMTRLGCKEIAIQELVHQNFIIITTDGILIVKHWLWHNCLRRKTYTPSNLDARNQVGLLDNGTYELLENMAADEKSIKELIEINDDNPIAKSKIKDIKSAAKQLSDSSKKETISLLDVQGHCTVNQDIPQDVPDEKDDFEVKEHWDVPDKIRIDEIRIGERSKDVPQDIPYNKYKLYGKENNVFLTDEELEKIYSTYVEPEKLIDKVGYILLNCSRPKRNHYAYINKIALEDKWTTKESLLQAEALKEKKKKLELEYEKQLEKYSEIEEMERLGINDKDEYEQYKQESVNRGKEQIINALGFAPWENSK